MRKKVNGLQSRMCCSLFCITLCVPLLFGAVSCAPDTEDLMQAESVYENEEKLANPYSSYQMERFEQEIDETSISGTYEGLDGMVLLWTFDAPQDMALDVSYLLSVRGGQAKLVVIDPDDKISTLVEYSSQTITTKPVVETLSIKKGLNRIKLAGAEAADITFEVSIDKGGFVGAG